MPTRPDPFTPRGPLSREQLARYVRGELDAASQHEVEQHMERDALIRDAVEGLCRPGAIPGFEALDRARPHSAVPLGSWRWWAAGGLVIVAGIAFWWLGQANAPTDRSPEPVTVAGVTVPTSAAEMLAFEEEVVQAESLPESLRSTVRGTERFMGATQVIAPVDRKAGPDSMRPRSVLITDSLGPGNPRPGARMHGSRQLLFLHDLKTVHPSELYPIDPVFALSGGGVEARFGEAQGDPGGAPDELRIPYIRFMDDALGKFVSGDRQGCLSDLFVVLGEYPDDVNALFYGGLCCHDMGLFQRATSFLERSRIHAVDTFSEEAEWYHALSYERLHGRAQAIPLLEQVVRRKGYYAVRAAQWLAEMKGQ